MCDIWVTDFVQICHVFTSMLIESALNCNEYTANIYAFILKRKIPQADQLFKVAIQVWIYKSVNYRIKKSTIRVEISNDNVYNPIAERQINSLRQCIVK